VGAFVNDRWANFTIAHCGADDRAARELGASAIKGFFAPGRPYSGSSDETYRRLLQQWGGVPDHLKRQFRRYLEPETGATTASASGGDALTQSVGPNLAIWEQFDADTLAERGIVIAGDPTSCIRGLREHQLAGADEALLLMQTDAIPHARVMDSITLLGKEVLPEFAASSRSSTQSDGAVVRA
jgi:hypothetical protein